MQYTLDQLCRGVGDPNTADTIRRNQRVKQNHHLSRRGYTPSKENRYLAEIPMWVLFHPEFKKYFSPEMDEHERKKNLFAFLRKYGQGYMVVNNL